MVIVIIEHFLTREGKSSFPGWLISAKKTLSSFDGYKDLNIIKDIERPHRLLLRLRFDNLKNLKNWSSSKEHQDLLFLLADKRIKKQVSQLYEVINDTP